MSQTLTVFLSSVTSEFGTLRPKLAKMVENTRFLVRYQDEFPQHGVRTLHMLENEVAASNAVFHLIGNSAGFNAPASQVEEFLGRHAPFEKRFPEISAAGRKGEISYTQWEAWLAHFLGKQLFLYLLQTPSSNTEDVQSSQKTHEAWLRERDFYPKKVADLSDLLEEIRKSLFVLWETEAKKLLSKEELDRPRNLPFDSLGEYFTGRDPKLSELESALKPEKEQKKKHSIAIFGMGGVGKTRLAIEYGLRHEEQYRALLYVTAKSPESLRQGLEDLSGVLELPARETAAKVSTQAAGPAMVSQQGPQGLGGQASRRRTEDVNQAGVEKDQATREPQGESKPSPSNQVEESSAKEKDKQQDTPKPLAQDSEADSSEKEPPQPPDKKPPDQEPPQPPLERPLS